MVSVIIPVFNVEAFLREALDSVINQTYRDLEIIIIDDGSTDSSGQICDEYKLLDDRVIVYHQENKGLSNARNKGLELMSGNYVAFLDSDDIYLPSFIESMLDVAIFHHAELVVCKSSMYYSTTRMHYEKKKILPILEQGIYDKVSSLRALADGKINVAVWNKLYISSLWDKLRFPDGRVYEDAALAYMLIDKCNKVFILDNVLCFHRIRSNSITHTTTAINIRDRMLADAEVISFIKNRIPEVFSKECLEEQTKKQQRRLIKLFIKSYNYKGKEIQKSREDMKKVILKNDEKDLPFLYYTAYKMVRHCSFFCPIVYHLYKTIIKVKSILQMEQ